MTFGLTCTSARIGVAPWVSGGAVLRGRPPMRTAQTLLATFFLALFSCGTASSPVDSGSPAPADAGTTVDAGPASELDLLGRACVTNADCGTLQCRQDPVTNLGHHVCTLPCTSTDDVCSERFGSSTRCALVLNAATEGFCAYNCAPSGSVCPAGSECVNRSYCDRIDRTKCTGSPASCADQADCYASGCSRCSSPCSSLNNEMLCATSGALFNNGIQECFPTGSCSGGPFSGSCSGSTSSSCTSPCMWSPACIGIAGSDGQFRCPATNDAECTMSGCSVGVCRGQPIPCSAWNTVECTRVTGCRVE